MKTFKTTPAKQALKATPAEQALRACVLAKSIAAALVAAAGLAAPAVVFASPDDGMICKSGYTGAIENTRFKCSKPRSIDVGLECTNLRFPTMQRRVVALPASDGRDVCARPGITVAANGPLTGLTLGQDYVFAAANEATINTRVEGVRNSEASAAQVPVAEVDVTRVSRSTVVDGGFGGNDVVRLGLKVFTFAIAAPNQFTLPPTVIDTSIVVQPGPSLPSPRLP